MKFTVALHSAIDLITNSSTEMFMDFSGSIGPIKELINELLKSSGKTCDEVFKISIRPDWWGDGTPEDWGLETWDDWKDDGESRTTLHFETLDDQYADVGKLVEKFIGSIEMNEYMC